MHGTWFASVGYQQGALPLDKFPAMLFTLQLPKMVNVDRHTP